MRFLGDVPVLCRIVVKADETQGKEIRYVDVTSEYPWVTKYGSYLVGHPTILFEPEDQDPTHYYGIMSVDIVPPYDLYNPVLPLRQKGKLTFSVQKNTVLNPCLNEFVIVRTPSRNVCCVVRGVRLKSKKPWTWGNASYAFMKCIIFPKTRG